MAILKVARLGHPVLRRAAAPVSVSEIDRPETQRLIDDMIETMREYQGVGLAANQVHVSKQIAVIEVQRNPRYPEALEIPLTVIINPEITPSEETMAEEWEGCLSVPDLRGKVARHAAVHLRAHDRTGRPFELEAKEFFARVIQHEADHLQGKVFIDRMRDLSTLTHLAEWSRHWLGVTEQNDKVLVCCKDLFFTARIGETGKLVGTPVEFVRAPAELAGRLGDSGVTLVIVDLTAQGWDYEDLFASLEARRPRPPVLGFTTHALARATQPYHGRCDRVVTKETLTQELPDILKNALRGTPAS